MHEVCICSNIESDELENKKKIIPSADKLINSDNFELEHRMIMNV